MPSNTSLKSEAWRIFDFIVDSATENGVHSNPWIKASDASLHYEPDYGTLETLLGVPLALRAGTQSGVPALALDVWLSYELRRAGFGRDQVWPRPTHPRILPASVSNLLGALPASMRSVLENRIQHQPSIRGVTSSSAVILGKNYLKQVDVIITDWVTGPELLISTKRMDSSYGKNAPNRVEESYGDAKNLRLRHPIAALGFAFGLRSDILTKEPKTADWIFDLLVKLGKEDDAYDATCLFLLDYPDEVEVPDSDVQPVEEGVPEATAETVETDNDVPASMPSETIEQIKENLPKVTVLRDKTPAELSADRFLAEMVSRVLSATPINMHEEARRRRASAPSVGPDLTSPT